MEQIFTDEEIRVMYQDKQRVPFPRRRMWLGAFYAVIFIAGGIGFYLFLFWLAMKIFNVN